MATNKAPKSKFDKLFALLNDEDTAGMAWGSIMRLQLNAEQLQRLEEFASGNELRMNELFDPWLALVQTPADAIVLVQKYPNDRAAYRIMRVVCSMDLQEADVLALSEAWPAWTQDLVTGLLEKKNYALDEALEALATAEDERDEAKDELGFTSAQAVAQNKETEAIMARAEAALAQSEQLVNAVNKARTGYEEAEHAYNTQLGAVDDLQLSVTELTRRLSKGTGKLRGMIPDISTRDMMAAAQFLDQADPEEEQQLPDWLTNPQPPEAEADQDTPQDAQAPTGQAPQPPVGSDASLWNKLAKLRPDRIIKAVTDFANSDEPVLPRR